MRSGGFFVWRVDQKRPLRPLEDVFRRFGEKAMPVYLAHGTDGLAAHLWRFGRILAAFLPHLTR